jgi:hypothetical protein
MGVVGLHLGALHIVLCCAKRVLPLQRAIALRRADVEPPSVEVRFHNLDIDGNVYVGSRALPTLLNSYRNAIEVNSQQAD